MSEMFTLSVLLILALTAVLPLVAMVLLARLEQVTR